MILLVVRYVAAYRRQAVHGVVRVPRRPAEGERLPGDGQHGVGVPVTASFQFDGGAAVVDRDGLVVALEVREVGADVIGARVLMIRQCARACLRVRERRIVAVGDRLRIGDAVGRRREVHRGLVTVLRTCRTIG